MTAREEINRLSRRLFRRQSQLIAAQVHEMSPAFRAYERRARARVRSFEREASYAEVIAAASTADRVFVGDYHTLRQAQRSFLKLIERRTSSRPLLLALEFIQGRHQAALDDWLRGELSEDAFLTRIEYRRHQLFETWPHFRPILELARTRKLPVVAIDRIADGRTGLAERDAYAARRIRAALVRHPTAQLYVLSGQLHVAPPHLPAALSRELPDWRASQLVLYQNCERLYWALQDQGRELTTEAVLVRPGEYCLINTPPVVVQQSFLDWVEGGGETLETGHQERKFKALARFIARALQLDDALYRDALSHVSVYTAGDLGFLSQLPSRGFSRSEVLQIQRQILSRESYYIPRAQVAYLANLSINHAAEEATHFLRHAVAGADDEPRTLVDAFYTRCLEEAFGFCGSKLVNPRRKCPHESDYERLARAGDRLTREVATLVLDHRRIELGRRSSRSLRRLYREAGADLFNAVTHGLGYMLGDRLYAALATGQISKSEMRALFLDPLADEAASFLTYLELSRRLSDVVLPRHVAEVPI